MTSLPDSIDPALDESSILSALLYWAEIEAGVDPLEAIRRKIDRDETPLSLRRQEAAALPPDRPRTAAQGDLSSNSPRQNKPRLPSLTRIAAQAKKAGIDVARIDVAADGSYTVVSKDEFSTEPNPWLDGLKVTKQ